MRQQFLVVHHNVIRISLTQTRLSESAVEVDEGEAEEGKGCESVTKVLDFRSAVVVPPCTTREQK
jgi:hypothetical protein